MAEKIIEKLLERIPLAVIVIGVVVFVMGAAGGLPLGNPPLQVTDPTWRVGLGVMGLILVGSGLLFIWREGQAESKKIIDVITTQVQELTLPQAIDDIADATLRDEIQRLIAEARQKANGPQALYDIGMIYRDRLHDYAGAIWWFVESIRRKPSASPPYDRIAEIFERFQEYDQALRWFIRSADADPGNYWPCDRLGLLYRDQKGDLEQAIKWFKESIRRRPTGNSTPYDRIAEIYRDKHQDYDQAIEWFTKSAKADPSNYWPCDRLGELYRDRKQDFPQAIKWFQESIARNPHNPWPRERLKELQERQK
jgi:tetratricopeptide (TPR) repeat protein